MDVNLQRCVTLALPAMLVDGGGGGNEAGGGGGGCGGEAADEDYGGGEGEEGRCKQSAAEKLKTQCMRFSMRRATAMAAAELRLTHH